MHIWLRRRRTLIGSECEPCSRGISAVWLTRSTRSRNRSQWPGRSSIPEPAWTANQAVLEASPLLHRLAVRLRAQARTVTVVQRALEFYGHADLRLG